MDGEFFDAVVQRVAVVASRRGVLRAGVGALAGVTLGAVATALGVAEVGATHFTCLHVGQRCKDKSECCSSRCKRGRCRAHHVGRCTAAKDSCLTGTRTCGGGLCECQATTGGAYFCAQGSGICMTCTTDAECAVALNSPGAACIAIQGNCPNCNNISPTVCQSPCTR